MSGILGIMGQTSSPEEQAMALNRMAEPIRYAPSQTVDHFLSDRCAMAVVDYGEGFSFLKPPAVQRDGVHVVMYGEVFPDAGDVPQELQQEAPTIQRAEYCLHLYLESGPSFVKGLNGSFCVAVYDSRSNELHVYNDRFSSQPLYVWDNEGQGAFATAVRSILCFRDDIGRTYDRIAVAELIGLGRVFGEKTLLEDIRRLPSACHAKWVNGRWGLNRYAQPVGELSTKDRPRRWQDAAAELVERLRGSMARRLADTGSAAVLLSGGMDSRLVLAAAPDPISAATFANKGASSREANLAMEIARVRGVPCTLLEREEDYYATNARGAAEIADGQAGFEACHSVGAHGKLFDSGARVILTGMFFDTAFKCFFGKMTIPDGIYESSPPVLRSRRIGRLLAETTLVRRADRLDLMAIALSEEMKDALAIAKEHQVRRLAAWFTQDGPVDDLADRFVFNELQSSGGFVSFLWGVRSRFVERSPVYDNDLVNFALSLPASWKVGGRLVRRAAKLAWPAMARIRDGNTGLPGGLCPPWSTMLGKIGGGARGIARFLSRYSRRLRSMRHRPGYEVFGQGSWHDLNAALKRVDAHRELVEWAISRLDGKFFDMECIRRLLQHDLAADRPQLWTVFQPLVTFALFDEKWGPGARKGKPAGLLRRIAIG